MNSHVLIIEKLKKLKGFFEEGRIPVLHKHEVNPGLDLSSRENTLYFIMTCALNFQRVSPTTWASALKTWNDPETNYVFFPEKVAEVSDEILRNSLLKHKLALQPNKHIAIWRTISETWHRHFEDDPRKLFEQNGFDVERILHIMQFAMKKDFPYLSGPKLSNYSLFILLTYSNLPFEKTHLISIIPDTHIMQATEVL